MTLLVFLGCAHLVDISVTGAAIAPTMANQAAWDGPDSMPAGAGGLLQRMAAAVDPDGSLTRAAGEAASAKAKPDPFGTVTLVSTGERNGEQSMLTLATEDTLAPDWTAAPATFTNVTLDSDVRLRVALIDKDVVTDDPIGTVEVPNSELLKAMRAGAPVEVDVSSQSSGQLLKVRIKVEKR